MDFMDNVTCRRKVIKDMWDPFPGLTHFGGSEPSPGCH